MHTSNFKEAQIESWLVLCHNLIIWEFYLNITNNTVQKLNKHCCLIYNTHFITSDQDIYKFIKDYCTHTTSLLRLQTHLSLITADGSVFSEHRVICAPSSGNKQLLSNIVYSERWNMAGDDWRKARRSSSRSACTQDASRREEPAST